MSDWDVYDEAHFRLIGRLNRQWGICGFAGAAYAMFHLNPGVRQRLLRASQPFAVLADIKTYFQTLLADGNRDLMSEIDQFTHYLCRLDDPESRCLAVQSFVGFVNDAAARYADATPQKLRRDLKFCFAMPPRAVSDYLLRMWGHASVISKVDPGGDAIIGVLDRSERNAGSPYDGLRHWVYRKGMKIYTYDDEYAGIEAVDPDYVACWYISITGKA